MRCFVKKKGIRQKIDRVFVIFKNLSSGVDVLQEIKNC